MTNVSNDTKMDLADELIYCDDNPSELARRKAQEIVEYLQKLSSPDHEIDLVPRETVTKIMELLCLNLPVVWDEEDEEEGWSSDESNSSSDDEEEMLAVEQKLSQVTASNAIKEQTQIQCSSEGQELQDRASLEVGKAETGAVEAVENQSDQPVDCVEDELSQIKITSVSSEMPKSGGFEIQSDKRERNTKFLEDEQLWSTFVQTHKSEAEVNDNASDDDEGDPDVLVDCSESESDESDLSSDEDDRENWNCNDQVATFPYLNSDSDSEEVSDNPINKIQQTLPAAPVEEVEVITLDDEDDLVNNIKESEMKCTRCPNGKGTFHDKGFFVLHVQRHFGNDHFICPTCRKTFTKLSFCLGHEVRIHNDKFTYDHPRISESYIYQKKRNEKDVSRQIAADDNKALEDLGEAVLADENEGTEEEETDDEDPKFYPEQVVPSTTLYPYRGPKLTATCESYEVQLQYGRKKRTGVNTIAHVVLACRQQLKEQGRIPDLGNRFWKEPIQNVSIAGQRPNNKKDPTVNPNNANKRKRGRQLSISDDEVSRPPRRKRKKVINHKTRDNFTDRRFVSTVVCHLCQLCNYHWKNEQDLRTHRDEKHPAKKIMDLMTVRTRTTVMNEDDLFIKHQTKKRKRNQNNNSDDAGASRFEMNKENFLLNLGLISVKKLSLRKRKPQLPKVKSCYVKMEKLVSRNIPRSGRVFLCNLCEYFSKSRDLTNLHKKNEHKFEQNEQSRKRLNLIPKRKKTAPVPVRPPPADILSLVSSTSSHDYDELEDMNWRISKLQSNYRSRKRPNVIASSSSASSSSSVASI